jgi:hypothetical protein
MVYFRLSLNCYQNNFLRIKGEYVLSTVIQIIGIFSIALALLLVVLFFNVYKTQRSIILLGLPFGFLFLTLSYIFLGIHLMYPSVDAFSSSIMWSRVITQTWGFTLIASSYFLSGRAQRTTKHSHLAITIWSVVSVICIFVLLYVINPPGLVSVYSYNEVFAIVNIALLSYIIFFIVRRLELATGSVSGLISAPVAFAFIWLGQFLFLIWNLDAGGQAALIGSQIAPLIGLALLIRIYYLVSKRCQQELDSYEAK